MKRWHLINSDFIEDENADNFLKEIIDVCKKHNISISHEDYYGGFILKKYSDDDAEWLFDASIDY